MGWGALFLSFSGRINRAKYWLASLLLIPAFLLLVFMLIGPLLMAGDTAVGLAVIPLILAGIGVFISGLAIATKRLHDRDKSAWWIVLFYVVPGLLQGIGDELGDMGLVFYVVSFAISVWGLIELGFLRGTTGSNRYGPDPLAPPSQPLAATRSTA
jgi:uncharacterized membrane protein YhaH (DUF805 family)